MDAIRFTLCLGWMLLAFGRMDGQYMNWSRVIEDTMYYGREYFPERKLNLLPGPAQTWDFRSLRAPYATSRRLMAGAAKQGSHTGQWHEANQLKAQLSLQQSYATVTQIYEPNPFCPDQRIQFFVSPAYKAFFAGVLGEVNEYRGRMVATFSWPRHLQCTWTPAQIPDSCRITYSMYEEIVVDGEGTILLPTEIKSAYRQRVTLRKGARVELKNGAFWRDVTTLAPGIPLGVTQEFYRFVSAENGVMLVEIELNPDESIRCVEFRTQPMATRIFPEEPVKPDVFAFPNPSFDIVRFQLNDLVSGKYKIKILNILGTPVREMDVTVDHPRETITMDLGDLQRGTYLYRLQDSNGRTVKTKRVVLIQA